MDLNRIPCPAADGVRDDCAGVDPGVDLRPLEWSALLARLGAERDLRRELASGLAASRPHADFLGGAARVVGDPSHHAPGVNPDGLAKRKSTGGIRPAAGASACVAKLGARGQQ